MRKFSNVEKLLFAVIVTFVAVTVTSALVAWMDSLTIARCDFKELTVTDMVFTAGNAGEGRIVVSVANTWKSAITVDKIKVNGTTVTAWTTSTSATVESGSTETFTIICNITIGNEYFVTMFDTPELIAAYKATA